MSRLPTLPALTPDDRVWRLDCLGELGYPGHVRRFAQPSLKVVLSTLQCDPTDDEAMLCAEATDHLHQHEAWVPIAVLPLLSIGDLWQAGRRVRSPTYEPASFKRLRIEPSTVDFAKSGLAIGELFLLPLSVHPWHRRETQSYCVAVALEDRSRVLVPCLELIRFYFGSSGNLIQRLFTAPLTAGSLWADKHFDAATRRLHLVLSDGLSGVSAADIGRIAESRLARRAAAGIFASCQKASALQHPIHPYTGFPFEGITDLNVSGLWLPFGDQERSTFLVYRVKSCSHPFPFQSLSYEASNRQARYSGGTGDAQGGRVASKVRKNRRRVVDVDPGARRAQRRLGLSSPAKFPDLVHKHVWRE